MYKLSPSILAADFSNLGNNIKEAADAGAEYIHIDVMDGQFVPNFSLGIAEIKSIRSCCDKFLDVHLMINEPIKYIEKFIRAGADGITVHYEACSDIMATINEIRRCGAKPAVSIKPGTPVDKLTEILPEVSMVLIMCVEPGYGGQKLIPDSIGKIANLKRKIKELHLEVDVEVDGGINFHNAAEMIEAGANIIVAGTKVFQGDITENVKKFLEIFNNISIR